MQTTQLKLLQSSQLGRALRRRSLRLLKQPRKPLITLFLMFLCKLRLGKHCPKPMRQPWEHINLGLDTILLSQNLLIQQSYISPWIGSPDEEISWRKAFVACGP